MNERFPAYIAEAKRLANERGILWSFPISDDGSISKEKAWDLTALCGSTPPPTHRLADLGYDRKTLPVLNGFLEKRGRQQVTQIALSNGWQDLVKATALHQVLVRRNSPGHVYLQIIRPLRVLGTCVHALSGNEPWEMTTDDIVFAHKVSKAVQASGKLGELVAGVVNYIMDARHLCDNGPFFHLIQPQRTEKAKRGPQVIRTSLKDRKASEKLPDMKALWELVRIVFTEKPQTFADAIRFAQIRVLIITGLRVGEVCSIPADWKRTKEYVSLPTHPSEDTGFVSTSVLLRHFAEKQRGRNENSSTLYEKHQDVPLLFQDILEETLEKVVRITTPLRTRLRKQIASDRLFPEYDQEDLIELEEAYVMVTGNPAVRQLVPEKLMNNYRDEFSSEALREITQIQEASGKELRRNIQTFYRRFTRKFEGPFFNISGDPAPFRPSRIDELLLKVCDLEKYARKHLPTKIPDTYLLPLENGKKLKASELLFLAPKRSLSEGREGGICDVTRCFGVGRATPDDLINSLDGRKNGIFARYGESEEDRQRSINTHALRHLQNTELFRLGIADTLITKRFNRRSVAQSYVYDHRSLAEDLADMDLPSPAKALPEKPRTVASLIASGKASGPLVDQFKRIQRENGDEEAFAFLSVEADGFHATPYGYCVNSFLVDPCTKHLQCFDGCKYLIACLVDRQRATLESLRDKILASIDKMESRKGGIGLRNQLEHADRLLRNIEILLVSSEGDMPFVDGRDLSDKIGDNGGPSLDAFV